jgi:prefoldin subunit 1
MEMDTKLQSFNRQLSGLRAQVQSKERERKICEITARELDQYPAASTGAYKSVGKMFLKSELSTLKKSLVDKASDNEREIKVLQKAAAKIENEAGDTERNLKELIMRRNAAVEAS